MTEQKGDLYDGSGRLPNAIAASSGWAAGGIASTPTDLAQWLYALCSGAVVGDELTRQMFDVGTGEYGLGIERGTWPNATLALGHVGAIPGYVALAFYMTVTGNVVVVMTNADVDDLYLVLLDLDKAVAS
jgi:CubicO group peptidase (beta-lactamase class C family)